MDCEHFGALPYGGGIMDQPAGLMSKLRRAMMVFRAISSEKRDGRKAGEVAKWREEHQDLWNIVSDIDALRDKHG